ncbi:MAG: hypothetical protein V1647_01070 [Pseudomonadota bacterium]
MGFILYILLVSGVYSQSYTMTTPVPYKYSDFKTIVTEHFDIHYPARSDEDFFIPKNMEKIAQKTAVYLEEGFQRLTEDLNSTPYLRIQIIIIDNTDAHNGFATPIPQNIIYIYAVPPLAHTPIAEYDDWLKDTCFHELTHIINLSTTRGYSRILRGIFGTVISVNGMSPLNIIEGYTVFEETNMGKRGRGRSTFLHTMLRTTEYEKTLNTDSLYKLSQAPYMIDEWPLGNRPYLYGFLLFEHVARKYGLKTPGKISKHNAGVVPYYPSYSFYEMTGKEIPELWEDALEQKRDFYSEWINNIKKAPVTEIEKLPDETSHDFMDSIPSLSPDGKYLAYHNMSGNAKERIVIADIGAGYKKVHAVETDSTSFIKWLTPSKIIFNDLSQRVGTNYYELITYDIEKKSYWTLRGSKRVLYADVINENELCTIREQTGISTINIEDITGHNHIKTLKTLYTTELLTRISKPVCKKIGNGYEVYFIEKKIDQPEKIIKLSADGKRTEVYSTKPESNIKDFTARANTLTIIDDKDAVPNLYRVDLSTNKTERLTNFISGAFDVDNIDDNSYYITYYTSDGFRLGKISTSKIGTAAGAVADAAQKNTAAMVAAHNLPIKEVPEFKLSSETENKDYSPFKTLVPKFWLPAFVFVEGGFNAGAMIYGADALFRHQYSIAAAYDSRVSTPSVGVSYTNQSFYPIFNISAYTENLYYSQNETIQDFISNINVAVPINTSWSVLSGVSYYYRMLDFESRRTKRYGFYGGVGFDETASTPSTISSGERGAAGYAKYSIYPKSMGSTYHSYQIDSNIRFFIPLGWGSHHVLAFNNDIGYTYGDQSMFFIAGGEYSAFIFGSKRFLMRGYPVSYFATYSIAVSNIEYRFPIWTINGGHGLFPLFLTKIHGAIITDNGFMGKDFKYDYHSYGFELRTDSYILYYIPVTLRIGLYKGTGYEKGQFFIGISSIF